MRRLLRRRRVEAAEAVLRGSIAGGSGPICRDTSEWPRSAWRRWTGGRRGRGSAAAGPVSEACVVGLRLILLAICLAAGALVGGMTLRGVLQEQAEMDLAGQGAVV